MVMGGYVVGSDLSLSPLKHIENALWRLSASARRFDQSHPLEAAIPMLDDAVVAVAGRLADKVGRSALAAADLDGPDAAPATVSDNFCDCELPETGMRRGVDLEPFSQLGNVSVNPGPGFAARAVNTGAVVFVLDRIRRAAESTCLESELFQSRPSLSCLLPPGGSKTLPSGVTRTAAPSALND